MCTVTFIPKVENDFVLTSNWDEVPNRISLPLDFYISENTKTLFSKAKFEGGTCKGEGDKNRLICLMIGEFYKTKSITQMEKTNETIEMDYFNIQDNSTSNIKFNVSQRVNE